MTAPATPAPIVHFEIGSTDSAKLSEFYGAVLGWTFLPAGAAQVITSATGPTGMLNALGHPPETYVMLYAQVDDIAAALERVVAAGGTKLVGPAPLPDGRKFAWVRDTAGNVLGLLTPPA
ncbi:MAG: VOC family protein [Alphaproteobacteria bacterium]|nr:VOC family protein [Alphaproteobacteria bacterium]